MALVSSKNQCLFLHDKMEIFEDREDPFIVLTEYLYTKYERDFEKFNNYYQAFKLIHEKTIHYFNSCSEWIDLGLYEMLDPFKEKYHDDINVFIISIYDDLNIFLDDSFSQNEFNKEIKDPIYKYLLQLSKEKKFDSEPWRIRLNKISDLYNVIKNRYIQSITPKQIGWADSVFGLIDWVTGTEEVNQNQSLRIENPVISKPVNNNRKRKNKQGPNWNLFKYHKSSKIKRNQSFENLQDHSQINAEQFIFRDVNPQVQRIRSN